MIEIHSFLHKNLCTYLIDYIKENKNKTVAFNKRFLLPLKDHIENDSVIKNIINLYSSIRPLDTLSNIEIVYWPPGESHIWHDDTIYYDYTTITYLNDSYIGGETVVENYTIKPETGKLTMFEASRKHKVNLLQKGDRYVIIAWFNYGKKS